MFFISLFLAIITVSVYMNAEKEDSTGDKWIKYILAIIFFIASIWIMDVALFDKGNPFSINSGSSSSGVYYHGNDYDYDY